MKYKKQEVERMTNREQNNYNLYKIDEFREDQSNYRPAQCCWWCRHCKKSCVGLEKHLGIGEYTLWFGPSSAYLCDHFEMEEP